MRERFTAGAIGAVGRDLHRIQTAVASVDVMLAVADVAANGSVEFLHNILLFISGKNIVCKLSEITIDRAEKIR